MFICSVIVILLSQCLIRHFLLHIFTYVCKSFWEVRVSGPEFTFILIFVSTAKLKDSINFYFQLHFSTTMPLLMLLLKSFFVGPVGEVIFCWTYVLMTVFLIWIWASFHFIGHLNFLFCSHPLPCFYYNVLVFFLYIYYRSFYIFWALYASILLYFLFLK